MQAFRAGYNDAFERRKSAAQEYIGAARANDEPRKLASLAQYQGAQADFQKAHGEAEKLVGAGFNDTNYIFLSFVTKYLPAGVVGLIIAVIFSAAMSSTSGEINSLATVTIIDIYRRHFRKTASDQHLLTGSKLGNAVLGLLCHWLCAVRQELRRAD